MISSLKYMYITNRPDVALIAEKYGVDRIWIDLETRGKEKRQKGRDSVKSHHTINDIQGVKACLTRSSLLVRINPWDENSKDEIEKVLDAGADIIMLPMWRTADEVRMFLDSVDGRCETILLLETIEAEECLDEVLRLNGVSEIHIGMNDLHLAYGLTFMFQLLANGKIENISRELRSSGVPFGFGGVGKCGEGLLPTPEEIIMEHYRLGSTGVILSRSFCDVNKVRSIEDVEEIFRDGMREIRDIERRAKAAGPKEFKQSQDSLIRDVNVVVNRMGNNGKYR